MRQKSMYRSTSLFLGMEVTGRSLGHPIKSLIVIKAVKANILGDIFWILLLPGLPVLRL
jgi:hypothetical protein